MRFNDAMRFGSIGRLARVVLCVLVSTNMLALWACGAQDLSRESGTTNGSAGDISVRRSYGDYRNQDGSWAIYWYLCGSDLESKQGSATIDLQEMLKVKLPPGVTVVIQTGGANQWQNEVVNAGASERYVYDSSGDLKRLESLPAANMGDANTYADFLNWCNATYPAQRQMLVLWDHGGGSLIGMEKDERFDGDLITLPELNAALAAMPAASGAYELVGFDACLMATIDMVEVLQDDARYLVASEEIEPLSGWDYTAWLSDLAANPALDGASLGRVICDSYYESLKQQPGKSEEATLSVVDLAQASRLLQAYEDVGTEALVGAANDQEAYISEFGRAANASESYAVSGNTSQVNMVDLGDLVTNANKAGLLPKSSPAMLAAIDSAVLYQVKGPYRSKACGLACYYPYVAPQQTQQLFAGLGTSDSFNYFFEYSVNGELSQTGQAYVASLEQTVVPEPVPAPQVLPGTARLDGYPLVVDPDMFGWMLDLGPQLVQSVADVQTTCAYLLEDGSGMILLGSSYDYAEDWGNGVFTDTFEGYWYAWGDNLMCAYITESTTFMVGEKTVGYGIVNCPMLLNGEPYELRVVLVEEWYEGSTDGKVDRYTQILGAHKPSSGWIEEYKLVTGGSGGGSGSGGGGGAVGGSAGGVASGSGSAGSLVAGAGVSGRAGTSAGANEGGSGVLGTPTRELRAIESGDIIEPLFFYMPLDAGTDPVLKPYGKFTVGPDTPFDIEDLGAGTYAVMFQMTDYAGTLYYSDVQFYEHDGEYLQMVAHE